MVFKGLNERKEEKEEVIVTVFPKKTLNILKQCFLGRERAWERSFIRRFSLFIGNFGI